MLDADKRAIGAAFGAAASHYDKAAALQRLIAERLLGMTPPGLTGSLLDAGCGTGYGLSALHSAHPDAEVFGMDLATGMLQQVRPHPTLGGDIERLPIADQSLALYWSSLAWQWTQPERAISEAARALATGGFLRVATLGPDTLRELNEAFASADDHRHTRQFPDEDSYPEWLSAAGFDAIHIERRRFVAHAATLRDIIENLRTLGAHVIGDGRRQGLMSRAAWRRVDDAYEAQREAAGLPYTYDAIFLCATRA
ncbi:methyltransferase domain-containing protein [Uliginosibacterium sp. H1]|uniref:methyltransferase domain-containing protein n=1 Tax=Uliginosibacterium sp. H1 TaxID=3114757 RepID=UPI002E178DCC|nr:methyltransferase domain-containing protein [Uliginosibacterium sp. H1]